MNDSIKGLGVVLVAALLAYAVLGSGVLEKGYGDIENAVASKLRDPSSAEFRNIMQGSSATCGEVNGKNALGAYVGFKPFVYVRGIVLLEPEQPITANVEQMTAYYNAVAEFSRTRRRCYE
ncbi:MAG: hypothetical protein B7X90_11180 [Novosphingobium sp. 17-62-19]|uniref:hypothetical protein n=1 Tax=Novosphingobium sp. 17-62-19 TaxID=1970406 RepID=UPI000BC79D08|nr:hypothetical protein [Novosphingobium sp. 17-62-19]OZA18731.1 MAG: hypothetical protein B7X90_11180 [Novosphingobium sp. 17-62-19]HQS97325.1 hypothetical protein [Novosphingobium sp.]